MFNQLTTQIMVPELLLILLSLIAFLTILALMYPCFSLRHQNSHSPGALEAAWEEIVAYSEAEDHRAAWEPVSLGDRMSRQHPAFNEKYEYEDIGLRMHSADGNEMRPLIAIEEEERYRTV